MALIGLATAFVAFLAADLAGSDKTRWATRSGFVLYLFQAGGLGPAQWAEGLAGLLGGLL